MSRSDTQDQIKLSFKDANLSHSILSFPLQPAEELQFVWCELLSEALAALWTSCVTSDPDRWLKWNPLNHDAQPHPKLPHGADNMVPAV